MSDSCHTVRLLQALNDESEESTDDCLKHKSVKQWINDQVSVGSVAKPRVKLGNAVESITCLCYASACADAHTVQKLVQSGADVTVTDSYAQTALHWACRSTTATATETIQYLLSCDASLIGRRNKDDDTPLHVAARYGNDNVIAVLIQHGAEIEEQGWYGRTALHHASRQGHCACIHTLIENGANVQAVDIENESTPLHLAAYADHANCVRILIDKYNAKINAADVDNDTPLHDAAYNGNVSAIDALASYAECEINAKSQEGRTISER